MSHRSQDVVEKARAHLMGKLVSETGHLCLQVQDGGLAVVDVVIEQQQARLRLQQVDEACLEAEELLIVSQVGGHAHHHLGEAPASCLGSHEGTRWPFTGYR